MSVTISRIPVSLSHVPFQKIKDDILGKKYNLSLSFVSESEGRRINEETRGGSYIPNVLSFPLSDDTGEVYITTKQARREASQWQHGYEEHVIFLFIHGLLHLQGYDHGKEMELLEEKYLKKYRKKAANPQN